MATSGNTPIVNDLKSKACYVKHDDAMGTVICTPDGVPIPGQKDMSINFPMGGLVTVTVEIVISGIQK